MRRSDVSPRSQRNDEDISIGLTKTPHVCIRRCGQSAVTETAFLARTTLFLLSSDIQRLPSIHNLLRSEVVRNLKRTRQGLRGDETLFPMYPREVGSNK